MTSTEHSAAEMDNEDVLHETSDIDLRTILAFGAGMVVLVVGAALLMWLMFRYLEHRAAANDPQMSPLARPAGQLPPLPRLQTNEPEGLAKLRAGETKTLEGYGWINQLGGVAHMPIAEAKKLIAQRGLPVRADAPADPRFGTHAYAMGESTGGRTIGVAPAPGGSPPPPAAATPEPHGPGR